MRDFEHETIAHTETGIEPSCDPDWSTIFGADEVPTEDCTTESMIMARALMRKFLGWAWQDGMRDPAGLMVRCIVLCWVFLPQLEILTLTELSLGFGRTKQAIGKWVDKFKIAFPNIRNKHMRD